MSIQNSSPGFNGKFYWFTAVVENTNDPRHLGRLRCRIIGKDTELLNKQPSEELTWATPLHPLTGTHASLDVKPSDYVFGFFLDDKACQMPVIVGVYPGIKRAEDDPTKGFSPQLTSEEKKEEPTAPEGIKVAGKTLNTATGAPQLSRGTLDGTIVKQTNKELAHVCDITLQVKNSVYYEKFKRSQIMQAIRTFLTRLSQLFGTSPDEYTSKLIIELKRLTAWLKEVQKNIKIIQDFLTFVVSFANLLGQIIKWIMSLPQRLLAFLSECITKFAKSIGSIVSDLVAIPGVSGGDYTELLNTVKESVSTIESTAKSATNLATSAINLPTAISSAITNPSSVDINNSALLSSITTSTQTFVTDTGQEYTSGTTLTSSTISSGAYDPTDPQYSLA